MKTYIHRAILWGAAALLVWLGLGGLGLLTIDQGRAAFAAPPAQLTPDFFPTLVASTPNATDFPVFELGTPASSPTPTPTQPGALTLVLQGNYDSCDPIDDADIYVRCEGGEYVFRRKEVSGTRWVFYRNSYSDTVIELDARATTDLVTRYGVIFRMDAERRNYYIFGLTNRGQYGLLRWDGTRYQILIPYTASNLVHSDTSKNHIKIINQGDQIALYVNDQWLDTVRDPNVQAGQVALFVEGDQPGAEAAFDTLRVYTIQQPLELPAPRATATATTSGTTFPVFIGPTPVPTAVATHTTVPTTAPTFSFIVPTGQPTTAPTPANTTLISTLTYDSCDPIQDEDLEVQCQDGELVFTKKSADGSQWIYYSKSYSDIVAEVDARAVSDSSDLVYGLLFRLDEQGNNTYLFAVTYQGEFGVFSYARPKFTPLIAYTRSPAVAAGASSNHLKVIAQGSQFTLLVNDQQVGAINDARLSAGRVALYVESDAPNVTVAFDNLTVSEIKGSTFVAPTQPTARPTTATRPTTTPQDSMCKLNPGEAGLLINNNYIGKQMRFTIGGGEWGTHDYDIPGDGKWYIIRMPPGTYTYTAHIAGAGKANGERYAYLAGVCRRVRFSP